ncbi:MAG: hypothetical protein J7L95_04925 [Prolixibacteraceae bacterium]|nr:hypothetical protein [Prolixibacteraceae bacterium]
MCTTFPDKPIVISGIRKKPTVTMLGFDGKIQFKKSGRKVTISIPKLSPVSSPNEFAWVFKIKGAL